MVVFSALSKNRSGLKEIQSVKSQVKRSSAVSQILRILHEEKQPADFVLDDFSFSVASSKEDMRVCFELAYHEYLRKGYVKNSHDGEMISSAYDLEKSTMIVMAKNKTGEIVGTLSIVVDGNKKGLPSDELFKDELMSLRLGGEGVAEVVRLAIKDEYKNSRQILIGMFNLVFNYVKNVAKCRYLIIEVNPRHVRYYERLLWFTVISDEKECLRVEGAPALLLCLDRETVLSKKATADADTLNKSLYGHFSNEHEEMMLSQMIQRKMEKIPTQDRYLASLV